MTKPRRYILRMIIFLAAVSAVIAVLYQGLQSAFLVNPALNGLITGVLLLGIAYNFRQVAHLNADVRWIEYFRAGHPGTESTPAPRLLAPMAAMLGDRRRQFSLSPLALRSLLDGISARLDESRDISRYTVGLLIFLGLLGTFWGLSQTIRSVGDVIGSLTVGGVDAVQAFDTLKQGLATPLSGMGTAFSSSLFGLGGSLVLGFLDLRAGQSQNRFFNETEEWLSGVTRLSGATAGGDSDLPIPAYVQALLEQTVESLDLLQQNLSRGEDNRSATNVQLRSLNERLAALGDHMHADQALLHRLVEQQSELRPVLVRLGEVMNSSEAGIDEATRSHIRNLDVYVARLIEELIAGREEVVRQIRSDIKLLARTIAATSEESGRR